MILRFFKTNQPAVAFVLPLVVLVLWLPCFFHPALGELSGNAMPVYQWIYSLVKPLPQIIIKLLCIAIVSFEAIYIHRIVVRHEVLYKDSYLPSLMFAVLASCLPEFQQFSPMLLVNLLMLFVMSKSFAIFKEPEPVRLIFDCSFLIAIASLIYLPAGSFFLLFLISLLILRPFHWRDWAVAIIGFALPYFFISVYFFWIGQLKQFYVWLFNTHFNKRLFYEIHFSRPLIVLLALFGGMLIVALFKLRDNFYKNAIKTRIVQQVVVLYLIIALLTALIQSLLTLKVFALIAFPMAVVFGYYFVSVKKRLWMYEVLFLLMIGVIFANLFQ